MAKQVQSKPVTKPDYRKIYSDIIEMKYPEKKEACKDILSKKALNSLDIIRLNRLVFGIRNKEANNFNQQHRSYDRTAIIEILEYQQNHKLNNIQLANYFKISRNSVTKWKRMIENEEL